MFIDINKILKIITFEFTNLSGTVFNLLLNHSKNFDDVQMEERIFPDLQKVTIALEFAKPINSLNYYGFSLCTIQGRN
jgi:hypothetical protein